MPNDFLQYWTAFQLVLNGGNPYDPQQLWELQKLHGLAQPPVIFMWNPPWLLVLLAPILLLPFSIASQLWIFCQTLFILIALLVGQEIVGTPSKQRFSIAALGLLFYPMWESIIIGQIGTLLLCALCIGFYLISRQKDFLAGLFFSVLLVKPHLFLILFVGLIIWSIRVRRMFWFVGLAVALCAQVLTIVSLSPQILVQWYQSMSLAGSPLLIVRQEWMTATIGTWLRVASRMLSGKDLLILPWIVTILGLVATTAYLLARKRNINWIEDLSWIMCLSLAVSPYCWLFDFATLLPAYLFLLAMTIQHNSQFFKLIIAFQLMTFVSVVFLSAQHLYAWFPICMLLGVLLVKQKISVHVEERRA